MQRRGSDQERREGEIGGRVWICDDQQQGGGESYFWRGFMCLDTPSNLEGGGNREVHMHSSQLKVRKSASCERKEEKREGGKKRCEGPSLTFIYRPFWWMEPRQKGPLLQYSRQNVLEQ